MTSTFVYSSPTWREFAHSAKSTPPIWPIQSLKNSNRLIWKRYVFLIRENPKLKFKFYQISVIQRLLTYQRLFHKKVSKWL